MKRVKTTIIALVLAIVMVMPVMTSAQSFDDIPQRTENGTVYVPLRLTAYAHGATVEWNDLTRTVYITDAGGNRQNVIVEAMGGFIEDGTSWIPLELAEHLFQAVNDMLEEVEGDQESIITIIAQSVAERSEILNITSTDGYTFQGRLTMPEGDGDVPGFVL